MGKRAGKPVSEMEDLTSRSPGPPAGRRLRFSAGSRSQEAVPKPHPAAALLLLMFLLCRFSRDKKLASGRHEGRARLWAPLW